VKRFYYNVFYHVFNLLKFEKNIEGRAYAASFLISVFESFNIASIVYILKVSNKVEHNFKLLFFIMFILIAFGNLMIFIKNNRYLGIIEKIESKRKNKYFLRFFVKPILMAYFTVSFLFLAFAVLMDAVIGDFRIIFRYLEQRFNK